MDPQQLLGIHIPKDVLPSPYPWIFLLPVFPVPLYFHGSLLPIFLSSSSWESPFPGMISHPPSLDFLSLCISTDPSGLILFFLIPWDPFGSRDVPTPNCPKNSRKNPLFPWINPDPRIILESWDKCGARINPGWAGLRSALQTGVTFSRDKIGMGHNFRQEKDLEQDRPGS